MLLDAGNTAAGYRPYELLKLRYILKVYDLLGYRAMNLGVNEASLPATVLRTLDREFQLALVSANVVDRDKGEPVVAPYVVVKVGPLRIGITGVVQRLSPRKVGRGLRILPPQYALGKYLRDLARQSHLVILLAHLPPRQAAYLASSTKYVDLMINAQARRPTPVKKYGRCLLTHIPGWGKKLGQLLLNFYSDARIREARSNLVRLGSSVADHPGTVALLQQYRRELRTHRYYSRGTTSPPALYAGSASCRQCHAQAYRVWQASAHARALQSLQRKNNQHDPGCLKCHVTGLHRGYIGVQKTPQLACVGCEACHGPAQRHVQQQKNRPQLPHRPNRDTCFQCHSWQHSENFQFPSFWARIKH